VLGVGAGVWLALLPVVVLAQEEGGRTLERSEDWSQVMVFTIAGVVAILLAATLGYLYRMRRHIVWDFQQPEEPHGDSHH
jgi:hypothetical protein